ncbi:MAG: LPS export ABC transporter permease LptG [Pseudohongiellaceae bacterium]
MRRIDRHIGKTVMLAMLVVIILTTLVELVFSIADELGGRNQTYTLIHVLVFVLQTTPTRMYELLPFSALSGALIGLGILASNNELVVIQSAGIQTWRIVWAAMKPTLAIMVFSLLLGEYLAPPLEQNAQSNRAVLQSGTNTIGSSRGNWQKIGNEFIHINAIAPGGEQLFGVARYRIDDRRELVSSSFAESAEFIQNSQGDYWRLFNVVETLIGTAQIATQHYLQVDWRVDLSPELLSVLLVQPERQSISGLYRFARYFENEGLEAGNYFLAFWKKLLQPLATGALVLLAISFVFGPLREATMGYRIFIAISIGLAFTIAQKLLEPVSLLYGISPVVAVLIPILVCILIGSVMLYRVR